jgi:hypothetical protein
VLLPGDIINAMGTPTALGRLESLLGSVESSYGKPG